MHFGVGNNIWQILVIYFATERSICYIHCTSKCYMAFKIYMFRVVFAHFDKGFSYH